MTKAARPIRDSASVVLWREGAPGRELYWVRRSREVSLGGGFYAFPGGRVDEADAAHAARVGLGDDGALRVAAARELFEETGILLASGPLDRAAAEKSRRALLDGSTTFEAAIEALGVELDGRALAYAGRWLTPPFVPTRFDARFFLAAAPADQVPEIWPGELVGGEWITPDAALEKWRSAKALLHPPALHILRCLAADPPPACLGALVDPPHVRDFVAERLEFQAGLLLVPLRTPTLPPATHTNCYLVGEGELVVIDPASPYEEEQAHLSRVLRELAREGRKIREILLTHEHHDHVGGVEALRTEFGVPIRAHRLTAQSLEGRVRVDSFLEDDEVIALPGPLGLRLRAIHTPGHARGHLCFFEETTGALLAGDMVAGVGSIVVDPPEGDMRDYLQSLRKLRALGVNALYPAHGPAIPDGNAKLDEYVAHREQRERQVISALAQSGGGTPEELVPFVYTDVAPAMYPLAARSLLAILDKLEREGRVTRTGDRRTLT